MAVELEFHITKSDQNEATAFSHKLLKQLQEKLAPFPLAISRYSHTQAANRARVVLRDRSEARSLADERIIKLFRNAVGGSWTKTDQAYANVCLRPPKMFPSVICIKARKIDLPSEIAVETVRTRSCGEIQNSKKTPSSESDSMDTDFDFQPKTIMGIVGYFLLAFMSMALVLVSVAIMYGAVHEVQGLYHSNDKTMFYVAIVAALFLFGLLREVWWHVGQFGVKSLAAVVAGGKIAIPPKTKSMGMRIVKTFLKGVVFVGCLVVAMDLVAFDGWHRHFWEPARYVQRSTGEQGMASQTTFSKHEIQRLLNQNESAVTSMTGVRIVVPRFMGRYRIWIYADGKIMGRLRVDGLRPFRFHQTDSGLYVYNSSGELLLKLSHEDQIPVWYPQGKGLFGEDTPTLAYEDEALYQTFKIPLAKGFYTIEILGIYTDVASSRVFPFYVMDQQEIEVLAGRVSSLVAKTPLFYPKAVSPRRQFQNADAKAKWRQNQMQKIARQFHADPLRRTLDAIGDATGTVVMDLSVVGLGAREFDQEQILNLRKELQEKYEELLRELESN